MSLASSRRFARLVAAGGALVFAVSLASAVWLYVWLGQEAAGARGRLPAPAAAGLNLALFTLFAAHHTVMARHWAKAWLARFAPPELERSLYVWVSSLIFIALCAAWQAIPGVVWRVEGVAAWGLRLLQVAGAILILDTARRLDVFDLAGLRQAAALGTPTPERRAARDPIVAHGGYRLVRHPIYLGWILLVWATPLMTPGRLLFALASTVYLCIGVVFEERSLHREYGQEYEQYRRRIRWRIVPGLY